MEMHKQARKSWIASMTVGRSMDYHKYTWRYSKRWHGVVQGSLCANWEDHERVRATVLCHKWKEHNSLKVFLFNLQFVGSLLLEYDNLYSSAMKFSRNCRRYSKAKHKDVAHQYDWPNNFSSTYRKQAVMNGSVVAVTWFHWNYLQSM